MTGRLILLEKTAEHAPLGTGLVTVPLYVTVPFFSSSVLIVIVMTVEGGIWLVVFSVVGVSELDCFGVVSVILGGVLAVFGCGVRVLYHTYPRTTSNSRAMTTPMIIFLVDFRGVCIFIAD